MIIESWILLAIGIGTQKEPIDFKGIQNIADGINHSIPTHKEMQYSIKRLTQFGLIKKEEKKYLLSEKGNTIYNQSTSKNTQLLKIWKSIEIQLEKEYNENSDRL